MFKGISKIIGNNVQFECGNDCEFDAIVFATGYKSTANLWLKVRTRFSCSSFVIHSCLGMAFVLRVRCTFSFIWHRTTSACSTVTDVQAKVIPIFGKVKMASISLVLRGWDWLAFPRMLIILPMTSCLSIEDFLFGLVKSMLALGYAVPCTILASV